LGQSNGASEEVWLAAERAPIVGDGVAVVVAVVVAVTVTVAVVKQPARWPNSAPDFSPLPPPSTPPALDRPTGSQLEVAQAQLDVQTPDLHVGRKPKLLASELAELQIPYSQHNN